MSEKVISLATRKPLGETPAKAEPPVERVELTDAQTKEATIITTLEWLDKIRHQVALGNIENMIVIAHAPAKDLFLVDLMPAMQGISADLATRFVGMVEQMKMELIEIGSYAPIFTVDGVVCSPNELEGEGEE